MTNRRTFLPSLSNLELHNVTARVVTWRGKRAVRLVETTALTTDEHSLAILTDSKNSPA